MTIFFVSSCATSSMEFTSAKTAVRSEKNLKKGEEWGHKALAIEADSSNALIPYFLAIEVYKPQKRWVDMSEMLDEAMRRNPEQKLEEPKYLTDPKNITRDNVKESIAYTIEQAVVAYREDLWVNLYNEGLNLYGSGNPDEAIKQFELALKVDPLKIKTYIILAKYYIENDRISDAHQMLDKAFELDDIGKEDKSELLLIKAEIYKGDDNKDEALKFYELAYNETGSISSVLAIFQLHLMQEDYLKAINWGEIAMNNRMKIDRMYFKDLLYNLGLAYRGAGSVYYDQGVEVITKINNGNNILFSEKKDAINNLKVAVEYFSEGRLYFLDAYAEDQEGADETAKYMKEIIKLTNETYIPFLDDNTPDKD